MEYKLSCVKGEDKLQMKQKQVADFMPCIFGEKDRLENLRSLTFAKNNNEKNVARRTPSFQKL